jgi:CubicO group peptidase (beta-lactamase class C family)
MNLPRRCFGLVIAVALTSGVAAGEPAIDVARIDARVHAYVDAGLFSGVVLVSKGKDVVYERAFGLADRAFGVPNTPSKKFYIASVSKPITAAAILLLADRGLLSINDPVAKYVPGIPNGDRITLEQLLTHYSGLGNASDLDDYDEWSRFPQTPQSLVARLVKMRPEAAPGASYSYSASNYHLLALVIEKVSKMPYGAFLAENIFKPLGMTSTGHPADAKAIVERLAIGYMPKGRTTFELTPYVDWTSLTGNGSLYSTARDLHAFHEALAHGTLLKPATVAAAYGFDRKPELEVGMFWYRDDVAGHRAVRASGSTPGYKSFLTCVLDGDVCVITLANEYMASGWTMANDLASLVYGKPRPKVPALGTRTQAELDKVSGRYQFGHTFYRADAVGTVSINHGELVLAYGSVTTTLLPLADGSYLDRRFWSFIRFAGDSLIYRNGSSEFTAPRLH